MPEGTEDYLVSSVDECAEKVLHLLKHPEEAGELGEKGQEHIKERFLLPRLLADELRLFRSL